MYLYSKLRSFVHFSISFLFLLFLFIQPSFSKNIWLLRHCDKPLDNPNNPCCSEDGYARSYNWSRYFMQYLPQDTSFQMYASGYNAHKICINENINKFENNEDKNMSRKNCQKSQRMYLTAKIINQTFYESNINTDYCVGEVDALIEQIRRDSNPNILIIWEHEEIIEIIHKLGVYISSWKNKWKNIYNLVFLLDTTKKMLYYDCLGKCDRSVDHWLRYFIKVNYYLGYHKQIPPNIQILFFILLTPVGLSILWCIYKGIRYLYYQHKRRYYVEIPNDIRNSTTHTKNIVAVINI